MEFSLKTIKRIALDNDILSMNRSDVPLNKKPHAAHTRRSVTHHSAAHQQLV